MNSLFRPIYLFGVCLAAPHAPASVIYTETFFNSSTTTAKNMNTVGWNAHVGPTATSRGGDSSVGSSSPAAVWYTNAIGGTSGYGFGNLGTSGTNALYWTTEPGTVAVDTIESLSFHSNNGTTQGMKFALRLDNDTPLDTGDDFWVVTTLTFDSTSGGSSGNWSSNSQQELFNFSTAGANWTDLSFTPGSTLATGSVRSTDLTGSVTAFGLYAIDGTVRFDQFEINAIPEPSAVLCAASASLLAFRRRRVAER